MEPVLKYFSAEKAESVLFICTGITASAAGICFLLMDSPFLKGMAYPLIIISLIQVAAGCTVYLRTPGDLERVNRMIADNKNGIASEEIPRMETVMKNFNLYKKIEASLIIAGFLVFLFSKHGSVPRGTGSGLFIQSLFMLCLDLFAEQRGSEYLGFLWKL